MYIVNDRLSIQMHDAWRRTITSKMISQTRDECV